MSAKTTLLLLVLLATAAVLPAQEPARLFVVVPESQSIAGLSLGDLRRIYIGDMTRWPDGRRIVPVMLRPRSPQSELFLDRVLRMSPIDFAQQWIGAVFRGRVSAPPVVVATRDEAVRFVEAHAESVAVIGEGHDVLTTVRILPIEGSLPSSEKYPLAW